IVEGGLLVRRTFGQQAQCSVEFKAIKRQRNTLHHVKWQAGGELFLPGFPKLLGFDVSFLQQATEASKPIGGYARCGFGGGRRRIRRAGGAGSRVRALLEAEVDAERRYQGR